jgi:putative phosphoribosyl transferase
MKEIISRIGFNHSIKNAVSAFSVKGKYMEQQTVSIPVNGISVQGDLMLCTPCDELVIFAHGSGSSRKSRRNRSVAATLNKAGISTLLFDLLTEEEAGSIPNRFNIPKLSRRLVAVTNWLSQHKATKNTRMGYFGASTGAAAALAASLACKQIKTIVSRGGRPDLLSSELNRIRIPVLLIVGQNDPDVLTMNQYAMEKLNGKKELIVVPGATHLFEEKGAMEQVALSAARWFNKHLKAEKRVIHYE